jgi:hypothetical protein
MTQGEFAAAIKLIESGLDGDGYFIKAHTAAGTFYGEHSWSATGMTAGSFVMIGPPSDELKPARQIYVPLANIIAIEGPFTPHGILPERD